MSLFAWTILSTAATRAVVFAALWLALAGGDPASLWFGGPATAAATVLSLWLYPASRPRLVLYRAALFAPQLLVRGFMGGLDVARRAFDPRLPVAPGWVALDVAGRPDAFRVLLGGVISVLPGTLAAGSTGDRMDVHVLQARGFDTGELRDEAARIGRVLTEPAPAPETEPETEIETAPESTPESAPETSAETSAGSGAKSGAGPDAGAAGRGA